ncbi:uncharacterized protein LOC134968591 isoform X2 [Pseudophryne corroboree]|uniref:uncharacterized protein LOC134968591 isoform X2 n=1 Tax=Pseudophryne corroboree TaxID=495146 RepID=UPI0030814EC2
MTMKPPDVLYLLLISLKGADALRVTMTKPLIGALREDNVTIPCDISDVGAGRTIAVYWTRIWNGSRHEVYHYAPKETVFRAGSYVVESEIYRGNAELHIPRVQFSDEGDYTCTVIVTPNSVEGKATLQVSARPSVTLTPEDIIHVELGTERSVTCETTNFYPQPVTIQWVRHNKGSPGCLALDRGTCTTDAVTNGDDTFSVTSHLTLYPSSMDDDGYRYSCIVTHRSLENGVVRNFTLTVTEREDNTGAVAGAVIGTLLSTLFLVSVVILYCKRFKKDPPSLSEISGNEQIIDMARTTLTCQITGFRPNDIEISVCLRRGNTMIVLHTWKSGNPVLPARMTRDDSTGGDRVVIGVEEQQGLINGAANHQERPLQLELVPVIKTSRLGTSSCQCSIHITPSFADNGAELSVHVVHTALRSPISVQRTLNVIGVAPKLLKIVAPLHLTHNEMVTMTCPINGFKPKDVSITWLRKYENQETEVVTWDSNGNNILDDKHSHNLTENEHDDDRSYSFLSALTLKASVSEDQGVQYICRTHHPATAQTAEKVLDMAVTARPVLDPIQKTLSGDQMDLSCRIHSFYPAQIQVTWYTEDGTVIPSHTSNALSEKKGLFYVTSTMKFHPTIKDVGKRFRCGVLHDSLVDCRSVKWRLSELISTPTISDITCDPVYPEIGDPVTLSCTVCDMYPGACTVQWYKGLEKMDQTQHIEKIQQDQESGKFHGTTELTLIPNIGDHNTDIHMALTHGAESISKTFTMNLKGIPILSKITIDPDKPSYGKPLTLRCKVTGCKPGDITVDWLEDNKPLGKHRRTAARVSVEKDTIYCTLTVTPTAEDYGKLYACSVKYKDIAEAVRSELYVTLPDEVPSLSDIIVRPAKPKVGKETSFSVTISGFSPKSIQVRWCKGLSPFPSDAVTSSDLQIEADSLYTCSSTLRFTPEQSDHNMSIRCEVTHTVKNSIREKQYILHLTGCAPDTSTPHISLRTAVCLSGPGGDPDPVPGCRATSQSPRAERKSFKIRGIECLTDSPRVGDDVTLRCNVDGCNADDCEFSWYNGVFPIEGNTENGDLEDGSGSFSTVIFTAEESDRSCTIRCEACYNYQTIEETFSLRLGEQDTI